MSAVPSECWRWREFEDRKALAAELSLAVAASLRAEIGVHIAHGWGGDQLLAVSGGMTPKTFFNELSRVELPWDSVIVTLCDERFVPPSSPRSNERLVRAELLRERAEAARFIPLYSDVASAEEAARIVDEVFTSGLPLPIGVAVLGMGLDGHTASLFPDAREIDHALDMDASEEVIAIHSPSAGEPRLTQTLQAIATSSNVFLHIEGDEKRRVFERAMRNEPALPISKVVVETYRETGTPVEVFWAP